MGVGCAGARPASRPGVRCHLIPRWYTRWVRASRCTLKAWQRLAHIFALSQIASSVPLSCNTLILLESDRYSFADGLLESGCIE